MARRSARTVVALAVVGWLAHPLVARAQQPICTPPGPGQEVVSVCAPLSLFAATRLVADFTVDQLFKPAPPAFSRSVLDLAQVFTPVPLTEAPSLRAFLAALAPVRFTQLDRTTGTLLADNGSASLALETVVSGVAGKGSLSLEVPRLLQGGYWRGPDVLQMAFWKSGRVNARLTAETGVVGGEVECLSVSPDGLLLRFASPDATPLLVRFRECDQ